MSNAYEAWKQLQARKAGRPDPTLESEAFLALMEENLQPAALKDFLESHAGLDGNEDPITYSDEEIREFLRDLDELRKLSTHELDVLRNKLLVEVYEALRRMKRLNYTGDHTHFEVLEDAWVVLQAVLVGKPMPKLERFRCPSKYSVGARLFQCDHQLPHGGNHLSTHPSNGMGAQVSWDDEQSVNPPVPYVDPHPGPAPALRQCEAERVGDRCEMPIGHEGDHSTRDGNVTWTAGEVGTCGQTRDGLGKCLKLPNHFGEHQSFIGCWSTDQAPTTRWGG